MNISTSKSETAPGHGFPAWGISPASVINCHPLAALGVPVHLYSLPRVSPLCGSTLGYQLPPLSGLICRGSFRVADACVHHGAINCKLASI